jgi:hypothetical protein
MAMSKTNFQSVDPRTTRWSAPAAQSRYGKALGILTMGNAAAVTAIPRQPRSDLDTTAERNVQSDIKWLFCEAKSLKRPGALGGF